MRSSLRAVAVLVALNAFACEKAPKDERESRDSHSGGSDTGSGGGPDDPAGSGGRSDTSTGGAGSSLAGDLNLGGADAPGGAAGSGGLEPDGAGGVESDGVGGQGTGGLSICGPSGPLPFSECFYRRECRGDESWEMYNPFGENCVCSMVLAEECELGCDSATGECND